VEAVIKVVRLDGNSKVESTSYSNFFRLFFHTPHPPTPRFLKNYYCKLVTLLFFYWMCSKHCKRAAMTNRKVLAFLFRHGRLPFLHTFVTQF